MTVSCSDLGSTDKKLGSLTKYRSDPRSVLTLGISTSIRVSGAGSSSACSPSIPSSMSWTETNRMTLKVSLIQRLFKSTSSVCGLHSHNSVSVWCNVPEAGLGSVASLHHCLRRCHQLLQTGHLLLFSSLWDINKQWVMSLTNKIYIY